MLKYAIPNLFFNYSAWFDLGLTKVIEAITCNMRNKSYKGPVVITVCPK